MRNVRGERAAVVLWRNRETLHACGASQASSLPRRRKRVCDSAARLHEQSAGTSCVILFTRSVHGCVHPRKLAAVRVRRDVHRVHALRSCFDPRKRHPVKTADAEWCQPVFVLNLPNSCSTRARADGRAERLLLAWTGLRWRHGRATEGVACGRPRMRSRPWRGLSPRPDGEDRDRRRSQLVFDGRRVLSRTRERDRQD